jgi:hypothetical protein
MVPTLHKRSVFAEKGEILECAWHFPRQSWRIAYRTQTQRRCLQIGAVSAYNNNEYFRRIVRSQGRVAMPEPWLWVPIACVLVVVAVILLWRPFKVAAREARLAQARKEFHKQREWLEVRFIARAGTPSKPEEPRWSNCEFDDAVCYVRHRTTGELKAFVAVTVALEGIGQMTGSTTDLMSNLQAGTAVFRFERDHWVTDGQVIPNLSPNEAIREYQNDLEMVGQELAGPAF